MAREIKFRAFDNQQHKIFPCSSPWMGNIMLLLEPGVIRGVVDGSVILMQYTGLKDKNGKEIYEGDILGMDWKPSCIVVPIDADDDFPTGGFTKSYLQPQYPIPISVSKFYVVLGNIYETPELLSVSI